jgi:CAAX amino terminal protease family.
MRVSSDDLVFAILLLVVGPVVDYIVIDKLKRSAHPRKWAYAWGLAVEWLLTIAVVVLLRRHGLALSALGQTLGRPAITFGLAGAGVILVGLFAANNRKRVAQLSPQQLVKVLDSGGGFMVPRTGEEQLLFALVSITAGFCEELVYRGWLWRFFGDLTGHLWMAVLLSAVAFGLAHAYQGRAGCVQTGIAGLVFSLPVLLAHSLVPSQVIHAGIDLANSFLLSKKAKVRLASL